MFEQFGTNPFFVPNPALMPEESFGWDAGVEFTLFKGVAILDVTDFQSDLTDKINGTAPGPRPGTFTYVNLPGESMREGVEVAARFKFRRNLTLGAAYTYTGARNRDGEREFRRSPHAGKVDLACDFMASRGTATIGAIYNGRMDDLAFTMPFFFPTQRVLLGDYWLLNATATYRLLSGGGGVRAR
jgi:vitamin B12 transporter